MNGPLLSPVLRILLLEDSRSEAIYIERTLTRGGPYACKVTKAYTIASGIPLLETQDFDVVLMDLRLPDVTGFSGLHAVQAVAPKVPIVILTGIDDEETERAAMENGAQDYLLKERASLSALTRSMRHAIQRRSAENIKSEFISLVSHELRTPLTSIHGSLGLIAGAMSGDIPPAVAKLVDIAHKNSDRLIRLVNDILDIDRIDSGRMYFELRGEALRPLLEHAVEANHGYAEKHGVRFVVEPGPDVRSRVDASRFTQVIANLLSNAAKFSPPGGEVRVAVDVRLGQARVSVTDQGSGIRPDFRDRIFTKFSQSDRAINRSTGGAGLGLYISKQIIEHMGGRIGFDSEPGQGASFWVELPVDAHLDALAESAEGPFNSLGRVS
jgi:signal transduction histidine kinase